MNLSATPPKQVIIVDDSHGPIGYYVEALESRGYFVRHITTVREALTHIASEAPADLYAIDIMMPVSDSGLDIKESNYGMTTGLILRDRLRLIYPEKPIIILTNVSSPEILHDLPGDPQTTVLSKPDLLPFELAEFVEGLL